MHSVYDAHYVHDFFVRYSPLFVEHCAKLSSTPVFTSPMLLRIASRMNRGGKQYTQTSAQSSVSDLTQFYHRRFHCIYQKICGKNSTLRARDSSGNQNEHHNIDECNDTKRDEKKIFLCVKQHDDDDDDDVVSSDSTHCHQPQSSTPYQLNDALAPHQHDDVKQVYEQPLKPVVTLLSSQVRKRARTPFAAIQSIDLPTNQSDLDDVSDVTWSLIRRSQKTHSSFPLGFGVSSHNSIGSFYGSLQGEALLADPKRRRIALSSANAENTKSMQMNDVC